MTLVAGVAALFVILLAYALTMFRIIGGPTLPDRLIALDLVTNLTFGFVLVLAIVRDEVVFLDVVMISLPVISLGVITIAIYLKRREYDR